MATALIPTESNSHYRPLWELTLDRDNGRASVKAVRVPNMQFNISQEVRHEISNDYSVSVIRVNSRLAFVWQ